MNVKMAVFPADHRKGAYDDIFSAAEAKKVLRFHEGLDGYAPTPLANLKAFAAQSGIRGLYVKDESKRFCLNAFKGLGGSYALAKVISEKTGLPLDRVSEVPEGVFTFVTATDGNHGRGVAWAAHNLRQKAVVYMPKGSAPERLDNIRKFGAEAKITELNYDDAVRFAKSQAEKNGWILTQDTSWEGYEKIPCWIMQGYMTLALEAVKQLEGAAPTHIFLQAGVGAMPGALTGFFSNYYSDSAPVISIVEPTQANCLFRTAEADDGALHKVTGSMSSIMAGLCCGEVCSVGWEVIRHHAEYFFACPDYVAADGMRMLGNPLQGDPRVISGESGAATTGLVYHLLRDPACADYRHALKIGSDSVILCISTEGDTDRENYRRIVWDGWYGNPDSRDYAEFINCVTRHGGTRRSIF